MRTTAEVIEELTIESEDGMACLIVDFESTRLFVYSTADDPLGELNEMVKNGGTPLGIIKVVKGNGSLFISGRPLEEFSNDDYIRGYLTTLAEIFRQRLEPFVFGDVIR